jgi:hypothetical protein
MSSVRRHTPFTVINTVAAACIAGALIPRAPAALVIAGVAAVLLVGAIALHPPLAAYTVIGVTPLIAGMDRGSVIPFFRPSEALALLAAAGLVCRGAARSREHGFPKPTLRRADLSILLIAVTSSVIPILWMLFRSARVESDDILYALVIWKFYAVYLIVRCSVRTVAQTKVCLYVAMVAGGIVAIIAILQALHLFGVVAFLQHYYVNFGNERALANNRGGATLSLPIAAADLFVFNIAIAFGLIVRGVSRAEGRFLVGLSVLLSAGVLAAGEVSGVLALVVAGFALARLTGRGRYVVRMIPALLGALWLLQPVLQSRLSDVHPDSGVPVSWIGRLDNLRTFFWPRLFSGFNFVLGIRPSSRVATTKFASGWVWIESGYTWLLWAGGIPLLLAFIYFTRENIRSNLPRARVRGDAIGAASLAVVVALIVVAVLMVLDPHLTYRGSADLLFALLALGSLPTRAQPPDVPEPPEAQRDQGEQLPLRQYELS